MFFFEKKNQKTFANVVRAAAPDARQRQKVFLLLFFQKSSACLASPGAILWILTTRA
jgi:hypothetical protein